jgi:hypothetical protein
MMWKNSRCVCFAFRVYIQACKKEDIAVKNIAHYICLNLHVLCSFFFSFFLSFSFLENTYTHLQAVIAATPFVKHVLDFTEQLDAAARKKASKTAAVLLPWCDMDAWRQCLLISAQLQDCATLHLLLCDIDVSTA